MSNLLVQIKQAEAAKRKALAALHSELGFESPQALASAILEAAGKPASRAAAPSRPVAPKAARPKAKSGKGRRLPTETRQGIIDALKAGRKGAQVAREFGVSYPTVHFIKQDLGLVQTRTGDAGKKRRTNKR